SARVNVVQLAVKLGGYAIALPLALSAIGGWAGVTQVRAGDPAYWSFWRAGPPGIAYLAMQPPSFIISPDLLQKAFGARDDRAVAGLVKALRQRRRDRGAGAARGGMDDGRGGDVRRRAGDRAGKRRRRADDLLHAAERQPVRADPGGTVRAAHRQRRGTRVDCGRSRCDADRAIRHGWQRMGYRHAGARRVDCRDRGVGHRVDSGQRGGTAAWTRVARGLQPSVVRQARLKGHARPSKGTLA